MRSLRQCALGSMRAPLTRRRSRSSYRRWPPGRARLWSASRGRRRLASTRTCAGEWSRSWAASSILCLLRGRPRCHGDRPCRSSRLVPGTMPASSRRTHRLGCSSCATRPGSRTRRRNTRIGLTACRVSLRSPQCSRIWLVATAMTELIRPETRAADGRRLWHAELAWLGDRFMPDVVIEADGGLFTNVWPEAEPPPQAERSSGLVLPGLANAHSHAFHRALRGHTQAERGTFWTWRERMYEVAARLDPDTYLDLATAVYAEMVLAGISCVGEFHYLHHAPAGRSYADENAMGRALIEAADRAGLRVTLLDTLYLAGGIARPVEGVQGRFSDGDADKWADRVTDLQSAVGSPGPRGGQRNRTGTAIHSIRAVPPEQFEPVLAWSHQHGAPLHMHLSEQRAENDACMAAYGKTPAAVFLAGGALGPRTTAVHATHVVDEDIALLGESGTAVCMCPTTERDLADGIGPARLLSLSGSPVVL